MKTARFTRFVATVAVIAASISTPALADSAIGVVNIQRIMKDSKAATDVRNQLQAKQKAFQADLDSKEKALHAEDQSLAKQRSTTDKDAFAAKVKAFQTKAAEAQKEVQTKKAQLDKAFNGALEQIQSSVTDITKQIATEKKLGMVVTSNQVIYADPALDVTDEVLKSLDAKLPSVKVNF